MGPIPGLNDPPPLSFLFSHAMVSIDIALPLDTTLNIHENGTLYVQVTQRLFTFPYIIFVDIFLKYVFQSHNPCQHKILKYHRVIYLQTISSLTYIIV